jgi:hypothetical protein
LWPNYPRNYVGGGLASEVMAISGVRELDDLRTS